MSLKVIKNFPDITDFTYNYSEWNRQFEEQNVILNGKFSHLYYPSHWTSLSLKFAFGGCEHYILDKMKYAVSEKNYLILNRDTVYESLIDSESTVETLTLNFTAKFTEDVFYSSYNTDTYLLDYPEIRDKFPVNFFQKLYKADSELLAIINIMKNELRYSLYSSGKLQELMYQILEYTFRSQLKISGEAETIKSVKRSTRIELFNRLNRAKDYIHSNYSEPLDLEMLSKISMLCTHHFLRRFKSFFGQSPYKYIKNVRMNKAAEMLVNTDKSITSVCLDCGYESLSSFSYLFKNTYGISPEKYRQTYYKKSIFK